MKKTLTIILGTLIAIICFTSTGTAQEERNSKIKIKITKEINGERKSFEKTYSNEKEMQDDPEYREFAGNKNNVHFNFSDKDNSSAFIELEQMIDGDDNYFYSITDDPANKIHIKRYSQSDADLKLKLEELKNDLSEHVDVIHLKKLDDIINNEFDNVVEGDEMETYVYVIRTENVLIEEVDGDEFGKKGAVGKSDRLELENLSFSPNPSDGKFHLQFNAPEEVNLKLSIYNLEGKEVYNNYFESYSGLYKETIDLTNRKKGIYLLEISSGRKRLTKKIVID